MQAKREGEPSATAARGRQQIVAILVTLGGSIVLVAFLGGSPLAGMLVQLIVLGLLAMQLFRGVPWARWVLCALTGLAALGNAWVGAQSLGADGTGWIVNATLLAIYAFSAFVLALSPAIREFLSHQRASREAAASRS